MDYGFDLSYGTYNPVKTNYDFSFLNLPPPTVSSSGFLPAPASLPLPAQVGSPPGSQGFPDKYPNTSASFPNNDSFSTKFDEKQAKILKKLVKQNRKSIKKDKKQKKAKKHKSEKHMIIKKRSQSELAADISREFTSFKLSQKTKIDTKKDPNSVKTYAFNNKQLCGIFKNIFSPENAYSDFVTMSSISPKI